MRIGVLALQGAFAEHCRVLCALGAECVELRQRADLRALDGLVLPGGESTAQGLLLKQLDMFEPLRGEIEAGLPVLGTCAGLILLAETLTNDEARYFATLPARVRRNAYGRQLGSFAVTAPMKGIGDVPMTFIRAPYIESAAPEVEILAEVDGRIVAVQYQNQIGLSFHPELGADTRIHRACLQLARGAA